MKLEPMPTVFFAVYALMSVVTFIAYGADKLAAKRGGWRTPETSLHLMALAGGWPGALLGQSVFRHKSRKQPFRTVFRITVAANCVAVALLLKP